MTATKSILQCDLVEFRPLSSHQIPTALLSYQQIEPDYISPYFSPEKVLSKVPKLTEKRRVLNHLSNRLLKSNMPGVEHAAEYLLHKFRNNLATSTIKQAGNVTFLFLLFLVTEGVSKLEDISRKTIYSYVENCQDRGLKVVAVNSYLVAVYTFIGFLVDQKILPRAILDKKIQLKLPQSLPKAIPAEDIKVLLSLIIDARDRSMILLLLRTGMRIGELLNVKVADIILPERKILIYIGEKNYQGRVVYFTEDAELVLRKWLKERKVAAEYLFYGYTGEKLSYAAARKILRKYLIKAGLADKGYVLHALRHTFATDMLNAGLRLEVLQQLLGHCCIEITLRYARLSNTARESAYFKAMNIIEQGGCSHENHRVNSELQAVFEEKKLIRSHS